MGDLPVDDAHRDVKSALRRRMMLVWADVDLPTVAAATVPTLLALPEVGRARCLAAYAALPSELPTRALLDALAARGIALMLPVVQPDDDLAWRSWQPGERLVPGRLGTAEPADDAVLVGLGEAQVVVVPGLAFDPTGARLGRGGGSFDRALRARDRLASVIAMAPDEAVVEQVPAGAHDIRVDVIVTPTRTLRTPPLDS